MTDRYRRGYFPADAESAYQRWRAAAVIDPTGRTDPKLEAVVKAAWLAGFHTRGQVDYGLEDELEDEPKPEPGT